MARNIRIGILTEADPLTRAIERALARDARFEVRALGLEQENLRGLQDVDVLLVSSGLPRGGALRLLGRSWTSHRYPRLLFLHAGGSAGTGATLTTGCRDELADLAESAARERGPIPARVTLRFLEPESGRGGAEAVASGR